MICYINIFMPVRRRLHSFYALLPVLDLDLSTVCVMSISMSCGP